ncbi:hypothetical protein ACTXGL_09735 [Psychrobacter sp. T6-6]|uniref:hypothetical protein n=1 Tax=Psychrobacter sp. T6-6 TaxID=3457452 RepID=UPI003FD14F81
MFYAACTKVQINDGAPFLISFSDTYFRDIVDQMPDADFEDAAILTLLNGFFLPSDGFINEGWGQYLPIINLNSPEAEPAIMGVLLSPNAYSDYPNQSTNSLACFTQELMRDFFASSTPISEMYTPEQWVEAIRTTPFDELQDLLNQASGGGIGLTINNAPATLRVMPCTDDDMAELDPWGGLDFPRKDIFDLVKARLTNTNGALNEKGLAPATYHADGDYVEFLSECSMVFSFPEAEVGLPR